MLLLVNESVYTQQEWIMEFAAYFLVMFRLTLSYWHTFVCYACVEVLSAEYWVTGVTWSSCKTAYPNWSIMFPPQFTYITRLKQWDRFLFQHLLRTHICIMVKSNTFGIMWLNNFKWFESDPDKVTWSQNV